MIEKSMYKVSCDIRNCKNNASYIVPTKGRVGKLYICDSCMRDLLDEFRTAVVPKSPKNAIKKAMDKNKDSIKE